MKLQIRRATAGYKMRPPMHTPRPYVTCRLQCLILEYFRLHVLVNVSRLPRLPKAQSGLWILNLSTYDIMAT